MIATCETRLHVFGVLEEAALPDLVAALPSFGLPFDPVAHFRSGHSTAHGHVTRPQDALDDLSRIAALGLSGDLLLRTVPHIADEPEMPEAWIYHAPSGRYVRGTRDDAVGVFHPADPADADIVRSWPSFVDLMDRKSGARLALVASRHALVAAARDPDLFPGSTEARMAAIARNP